MLGTAAIPRTVEVPSSSDEMRKVIGQLGLRGSRATLSKGSMVSLHERSYAGMHLLLRGRMKMMRFSEKGRVMILDLLDAGDVFGEMSLVDELGTEPTFAEALQVVQIETFPRFAFNQALKSHPDLAIALVRLMAIRQTRLERRLGKQVFLRVHTRLALLLLDLAERFGEAVPPPPASSNSQARRLVLDIPLSQQDLGNLIGASREIVSLTLSELRRRGVVSMLGRRLVIEPNMLRLEALAKEK